MRANWVWIPTQQEQALLVRRLRPVWLVLGWPWAGTRALAVPEWQRGRHGHLGDIRGNRAATGAAAGRAGTPVWRTF